LLNRTLAKFWTEEAIENLVIYIFENFSEIVAKAIREKFMTFARKSKYKVQTFNGSQSPWIFDRGTKITIRTSARKKYVLMMLFALTFSVDSKINKLSTCGGAR
jgi:hypothetical protein